MKESRVESRESRARNEPRAKDRRINKCRLSLRERTSFRGAKGDNCDSCFCANPKSRESRAGRGEEMIGVGHRSGQFGPLSKHPMSYSSITGSRLSSLHSRLFGRSA